MKSNGHATPEAREREADLARAQVHSTIDAIANKLTPGQLMDQSLGYLRRSLPAEFTSQLGRTVRDNPLPVALVGIGLAWLMLNGRREPAAGAAAGRASAPPERAGADARDDFGRPLQTSSTTGAAPQRPTTAERLGAKAGQLAQAARDQAAQAADATRDSARRLADEQPLVVAALGVAVGAVLGAMLPRTRREDELLGDTRDELLGSARSTLREQAGQLREPAERVMEHATQELSQAAQRPRGDASGADLPAAGPAAQWSEAARATATNDVAG